MSVERRAARPGRSEGSSVERYLDGRHAVVTGGGRGIGAAVSCELARLGASVTLMGRDFDALEREAETLRERFDAAVVCVRCNVADADTVDGAFALARRSFGDPYILVNNAGQAAGASFDETDQALWDRMLAVNLTGTFLCIRQALPAMVAAGEGRVVNVASTSGLRGYSHTSAYTAAKHGVVGLTRALAVETARRGVTVNAVCPSYVDTDMTARSVADLARARGIAEDEARALIVRTIPRRTLITPEEVASAVAWLCSPGASGVTGQAIVVAGGELA